MSPAIRTTGVISTKPKLATDSSVRGGLDSDSAALVVERTTEDCPVIYADEIVLGSPRRGLRVVCFDHGRNRHSWGR